jgi:hypothetical protein
MLYLSGVNNKDTGKPVIMTHDVIGREPRSEHVLRFFDPNPTAGPIAGKLIATYVLTSEQARELKAHL